MDLVGLMGLLSLARMIPVLEAAATPFLGDIEVAVSQFGKSGVPVVSPEVANLERWRREIGELHDSAERSYFSSTAAGIVLLVAGATADLAGRDWRISSSVANFWDSCDDLVHRGGGFARSEFRDVKTTLRGVEEAWRETDLRLLSEPTAGRLQVFDERLAKIRLNEDRRKAIARVVAECAAWPTASGH